MQYVIISMPLWPRTVSTGSLGSCFEASELLMGDNFHLLVYVRKGNDIVCPA